MEYDVNNFMSWMKRNYNVNVTTVWVRKTVEEIRQRDTFRNLSASKMQDVVWEKWLSTDLREHPNACLPKNLQSAHKQVVSGKLLLQIDEVRDISQPCYSQLMKISNQDDSNLNATADKRNQQPKQEKSSRVLKFCLTDGIETVFGMEYGPIPQWSTSIMPGTKICLNGAFTCRLGVFLLTKENATILGGGVQTLAEKNSVGKVLARALGNEELILKFCDQSTTETQRISSNGETNINNELTNDFDCDDDFDLDDLAEIDRLENAATMNQEQVNLSSSYSNSDNTSGTNINSRPNVAPSYTNFTTSNAGSNSGSATSFSNSRASNSRISSAIEQTVARRSTVPLMPSKAKQNNCVTKEKRKSDSLSNLEPKNNFMSDLWNDEFDDDFGMDELNTIQQLSPEPPTKKQRSEKKTTVRSDLAIMKSPDLWNDEFDDDFDLDELNTIEQLSPEPPTKTQCSEKKTTIRSDLAVMKSLDPTVQEKKAYNYQLPMPYTYLQNIFATPEYKRKRFYTVKAFFMTLTKTLDHNGETKWSLHALINDGSSSADVSLDNKLLETLIGFPATQIRDLKRKAKNDVHSRRLFDTGLANCKATLANFLGLMVLEFLSDGTISVLKIRQMSVDDVQQVNLSVDESLLPASLRK